MRKLTLEHCNARADLFVSGFRSRVAENRYTALEPLLAVFRSTPAAIVIHAPNGHALDGACAPQEGEHVANSTADFDSYIAANGIDTLFYVGYGDTPFRLRVRTRA